MKLPLLLLLAAALAAFALGATIALADDNPCKAPEGFDGKVDAHGNLPGVAGCFWKFDPIANAWTLKPYVDTAPPDADLTGSDQVIDPFPIVTIR